VDSAGNPVVRTAVIKPENVASYELGLKNQFFDRRLTLNVDAFDEEALAGGRDELLNKVAGVVITGSEDGAQATLAGIMEVLTFMNFTLPPSCAAYWVGEVGEPPKTDRARRLKNKATPHMAKTMARNLVYYAQLLKQHPLVPKE